MFAAYIFLLYINPIITLVAIIFSSIPLVVPYLFEKTITRKKRSYLDSIEYYISKIKDFIVGFEVVKSFMVEPRMEEGHNEANENAETKKYSLGVSNAHMAIWANSLAILMQFALMLFSGYFVISGYITLGSMFAVTQLAGMTVSPIKTISTCIGAMRSAREINERILNIIETELSTSDNEYNNQTNFKLKSNILFNNVSFSYEENSDKNNLVNINLKLSKGKKYAIVGPSGSGKSTLVKLMLSYFNDFEGNIYYDDISINALSSSQVYSLFSIIQQSTFLFEDTIENNITLYTKHSEDALNKAIKQR